MTSMGYTSGRCIYCGKPLYKPEGIACVRHKMLPAKDPLVPRPDPVIESPSQASETRGVRPPASASPLSGGKTA